MKLFRNMKQTLIKEGKVQRYLMYAIGEILLVMIGISLAFQVDNWNENLIKNRAEIKYYKNIRNQIEDDKMLIQSQLEFNLHFMAEFNYANGLIEANDRSKMDTLGVIVRDFTQYSDFDRQGNIYETMVNSGEIELLRNFDIINGIRELEERYIYINRMENIHYDAMMNHVIPSITPILKFSTHEIKKPDEVFSYQFQNLILALLQIMKEKDKTYKGAIYEIDGITKLINEELKTSGN